MLFLDRVEQEALEQAHHEQLFVSVSDIKLIEHAFFCLDCLVDMPLYVLGAHEVFRRILQELILEEFEANTEGFAPR